MDIIQIVLIFSIGSLVGWVIDTSYRSRFSRKFDPNGYIQHITGYVVPFLPIYGIGLLVVFLFSSLIADQTLWIRMLAYGLLLTMLELFGEIFVEYTIGTRLWDYSENSFNFMGAIDLGHAIAWMFLGIGAEYVLSAIL